MKRLIRRLFGPTAPAMVEARPRDAAAIAALHGVSFQRGWGEDEVQRLLIDKTVVGHLARIKGRMAGFILSRLAAGEAEILSVAVDPAWRGRAIGRPLVDFHLRRLLGLGVRTVFLEVDEHNTPARRLYGRAGFREVGRRERYYAGGKAALVLRRDLG